MNATIVNCPLSVRQVTFINERLQMNYRRRQYIRERNALSSAHPRGPTLKDPILEIPLQSTEPEYIQITPLTLEQIHFINNRLDADRRRRDSNLGIKNSKHPATKPRGSYIKDPIHEIQVNITGTANVIITLHTPPRSPEKIWSNIQPQLVGV